MEKQVIFWFHFNDFAENVAKTDRITNANRSRLADPNFVDESPVGTIKVGQIDPITPQLKLSVLARYCAVQI